MSEMNLGDIDWINDGEKTLPELQSDIAHVCHDVTEAACTSGICMNDIIKTLEKHGFSVVAAAEIERLKAIIEAAKRMRAEMAEDDGFLHSAACWNWAACESSKRQCAVCDFDELLSAEPAPSAARHA